ncbi:unnamed protein product [Diatraea saccharalis]|uniref:Immunoglobulin I-set domain-containing protein n=1 Tax=Diatraea saccharalis TaxID=40085 RepID=A0A9N9R090_9NEOP|nr:unnamed protein product [Diatraea saccharalis]
MKLTIRKVSSRDFSSYRCVAKNSLGETDGLIRLDGKHKSRFRDSSAENRVIGDYEFEELKDSDYESTQSSGCATTTSAFFVTIASFIIS